MNRKQIFKVTMLIFGLFLSAGCASSRHDGDFTVTVEDGNLEDFDKEPDDSELQYYNTIEEAILANKFSGDENISNIKEIAKVLIKDNDCVVLFVTELDSKDYLVAYKLKVKNCNESISYSTPYIAKMRSWILDKYIIDVVFKSSERIEKLKEKVNSDLTLNNLLGSFNVGDIDNTVAFGLWKDDTIKKLKIDGVSPTEVIELNMDEDNVYLWYYENLESDLENMDNIQITLD